MRILQIAPAIYPAISIGGPIYSINSLTQALRLKHEVLTLTTPMGLDIDQCSNIKFNTEIDSEPVGKFLYQRFYGPKHFTFSPATLWWLINNSTKFDLLLIHGVWNFPCVAAAFIAKIYRKRYVIVPHGTIYKETIELKKRRTKKWMLLCFVNRMLEGASGIFFTTPDELVKVQQYLGLKLNSYLVSNIVDAGSLNRLPKRGAIRSKYNISNDTFLIIHLGRISPKKNLLVSVQVLAELQRQNRDVRLLVVGGDDNGHIAEVLRFAEKVSVKSDVIFTGMLLKEDCLQALVDSDIFLLPSMSENFGMAVVEAMLAKVPVVLSDKVGVSLDVLYAKAGVVVPSEDGYQGYVKAISELILDVDMRKKVGLTGWKFASQAYSMENVVTQIDNALKQIYESK